jgi:hypothetical protein
MKQKESGSKKFEKGPSLGHNPNYSKDGVDITLIQWMLSFTPTERLQILQQNIRSIMRLRNGKPHT